MAVMEGKLEIYVNVGNQGCALSQLRTRIGGSGHVHVGKGSSLAAQMHVGQAPSKVNSYSICNL
jgi:hypothetical protein